MLYIHAHIYFTVNETSSLSSVPAPKIHVKLRLPSRTILEGHLTSLQCESILFAVSYTRHISSDKLRAKINSYEPSRSRSRVFIMRPKAGTYAWWVMFKSPTLFWRVYFTSSGCPASAASSRRFACRLLHRRWPRSRKRTPACWHHPRKLLEVLVMNIWDVLSFMCVCGVLCVCCVSIYVCMYLYLSLCLLIGLMHTFIFTPTHA